MHGSPEGMEISLRDKRLCVLSGGYRQGSSSSIQETDAVSSVRSSVMSTVMSSRVVLSFSSLSSSLFMLAMRCTMVLQFYRYIGPGPPGAGVV